MVRACVYSEGLCLDFVACGFFARTGDSSVYLEKGKGFGSFGGVGFLSCLLNLCHSLLDLLVPGRHVPYNFVASSEWLGGGHSLIVCAVIMRLSWADSVICCKSNECS